MRVAPLGAYFADDPDAAAHNAELSASVTHAHPEGRAGAVAVAIAAGWAWTWGRGTGRSDPAGMYNAVLERTPDGETRRGIELARSLDPAMTVADVAAQLGNGSRVLAQDTVPLCLWLAVRHLDDYEAALWATVSALGDRDTTCAIVGGIVAAAGGWECVPAAWGAARGVLRY